MQSTKQKEIYLDCLPEEARKELMDFYEFLLHKYQHKALEQKKELLKALLQSPTGVLPENYRFNREEAYER